MSLYAQGFANGQDLEQEGEVSICRIEPPRYLVPNEARVLSQDLGKILLPVNHSRRRLHMRAHPKLVMHAHLSDLLQTVLLDHLLRRKELIDSK